MKKVLFILALAMVLFSSCENDVANADQLRIEYKYNEAAELYTKAADKGDAYAMWRLAEAYRTGHGVEFNPEKAIDLLSKSVEAGCEEAKFDLGRCYIYGFLDAPVDTLKGIKMIEDVYGETQNTHVIVNYANCLFTGVGKYIEKNEEKALEILSNVTEKENPEYLYTMGKLYYSGINGTTPDGLKAVELLEQAFQKGEAEAASLLGTMYLDGNQIKKDEQKGVEWLKKGINAIDAESMFQLASWYLETKPKDSDSTSMQVRDTAVSLLKDASKLGHGSACYELGMLYMQGEYVERNQAKGIEYFKLAEKYGNLEAIKVLGMCYQDGIYYEKDLDKAEKLYTRYADLSNDLKFCILLSSYYTDGDFVWNEVNYKKCIEKAASLGSGLALSIIGQNYFHGRYGYPKDPYRAFSYIKKGAEIKDRLCVRILADFYQQGIGCAKDLAKAKEYKELAESLK